MTRIPVISLQVRWFEMWFNISVIIIIIIITVYYIQSSAIRQQHECLLSSQQVLHSSSLYISLHVNSEMYDMLIQIGPTIKDLNQELSPPVVTVSYQSSVITTTVICCHSSQPISLSSYRVFAWSVLLFVSEVPICKYFD